jgi:hypothetical protein
MQIPTSPTGQPEGQRPTPSERLRAVVRILLGQGQLVAATVALVLLFVFGPAWPALVAVAVASLLVVTSKLLFRG